MTITLKEPPVVRDIILKSNESKARIRCTTVKYSEKKFTEISLELIENTFPSVNGLMLSTYFSPFNAINDLNKESPEGYVTFHLRKFFKTEITLDWREYALEDCKIGYSRLKTGFIVLNLLASGLSNKKSLTYTLT